MGGITGESDRQAPSRGHWLQGWAPKTVGPPVAALGIAALLALLWAVSAWPAGGEFRFGWYPGAAAIYLLAIVLLVFAPWDARLRSPGTVALACLAALGLWTFASALWSSAADRAIYDGELVFLYATVFLVGLSIGQLRRGREPSSLLVPYVASAALVGAASLVVLLAGSDIHMYLLVDSTLRFPIGSRSANAAFFLIAIWPSLALAGRTDLDWRLRPPPIAAATLMLGLAVLSQSRASVVAAACAAIAYIAFSPHRPRAVAYLLVAALPVAAALPWLLDIFAEGSTAGVTMSLLRSAARTIAIATVAAAGLGTVAALVDRRFGPSLAAIRLPRRTVVVAVVLAAVAASTAFVFAVGSPVRWVDQRVAEFERGGDATYDPGSTRLSAGAVSNRYDAWRVAWDAGTSAPLRGVGAGGFLAHHTRDRHAGRPQRDPHNIWLLFMSELGVPGLLLFISFVVAALAGAARTWRRHDAVATLATAALVAAVYWLVQASIDPLWERPVVTAPVVALLAMACAPALAPPTAPRRIALRAALAGFAVVLTLVLVPLYLSDRYTRDALRAWKPSQSPARAYADLDRAKRLNPLADAPLIEKGIIARRAGDRETALASFREALDRNPDSWETHERLAKLVRSASLPLAIEEMETALRLNPRNRRLRLSLVLLYLRDAYRLAPHSLSKAYAHLARARALEPRLASPFVAEGLIARRAGDRRRALRAFRQAIERQPDRWDAHYQIAVLLHRSNPAEAARELRVALRLKSRGERVRGVEKTVEKLLSGGR